MDQLLYEQILQTSKEETENRGWPWKKPIDISISIYQKEPVWTVRTNAMMRGSNVSIMLRKSDLEVVHAVYLSQ